MPEVLFTLHLRWLSGHEAGNLISELDAVSNDRYFSFDAFENRLWISLRKLDFYTFEAVHTQIDRWKANGDLMPGSTARAELDLCTETFEYFNILLTYAHRRRTARVRRYGHRHERHILSNIRRDRSFDPSAFVPFNEPRQELMKQLYMCAATAYLLEMLVLQAEQGEEDEGEEDSLEELLSSDDDDPTPTEYRPRSQSRESY